MVGALAMLALLGAAAPARAASADQVAALLSAERAANGIPAGLSADARLSADCAAHDRYMASGPGLTHTETRGSPGYSTGGAFAAAHAVLAQGEGWSDGNPYEHAPLHLDQLLAPRLAVIGSADVQHFSCTTTFPGWTRPAPPAPSVYTFPGPGVAAAPSEVTGEAPMTPAGLAGLSPTSPTGPVLLVFVDAPGQRAADNPARLSAATLSGPSGPVALRTVDGYTPVPGGGVLAPYIAPGGFLVPVHPLVAGAVYHASVRVGFAGAVVVHAWSFSTRDGDPRSTLLAQGESLVFNSASAAPIRVTFTRAGGSTAPAVTILPHHSVRLHLVPGTWQLCGRQSATGEFSSYEGCLSLTLTGHPLLQIGAPSVRRRRLVFPLRLSDVLLGRRAHLIVTALVRTCSAGRCISVPGRAAVRTVILDPELTLPLPATGDGVQLDLSSPAFALKDAPWAVAQASFTWNAR